MKMEMVVYIMQIIYSTKTIHQITSQPTDQPTVIDTYQTSISNEQRSKTNIISKMRNEQWTMDNEEHQTTKQNTYTDTEEN